MATFRLKTREAFLKSHGTEDAYRRALKIIHRDIRRGDTVYADNQAGLEDLMDELDFDGTVEVVSIRLTPPGMKEP